MELGVEEREKGFLYPLYMSCPPLRISLYLDSPIFHHIPLSRIPRHLSCPVCQMMQSAVLSCLSLTPPQPIAAGPVHTPRTTSR